MGILVTISDLGESSINRGEGPDKKRLGSSCEEREAVKVDECLQKSVEKERKVWKPGGGTRSWVEGRLSKVGATWMRV